MEATLSKGQKTRQRIVRHAAALMHSRGWFMRGRRRVSGVTRSFPSCPGSSSSP